MIPREHDRFVQDIPVRYFGLLTGLRRLAVIAVKLFHLTFAFRKHLESTLGLLNFRPILNGMWFAINLFLLVGGYGIAASLSMRTHREGFSGALSFASNRAFRILPVYWPVVWAYSH